MKNTLSQLLFLALAFFIISASSCEKEKEPDLVPITTTGANTMGFYIDGVPHNKKGQSTWSSPYGVSGGISVDNILRIQGGGGSSYFNFHIHSFGFFRSK